MAYVEGGNLSYYIGGSNYNFNNNSEMEVTTFGYCPSEFSVNDPGDCNFSFYEYSFICSECILSLFDRLLFIRTFWTILGKYNFRTL